MVNETEIEGKIIQVLSNGLLQVQIANEIKEFNLQEIKYIL